MDKAEYQNRLTMLKDLVEKRDYRGALAIVDTIDWKRVKNFRTLSMVADVYEANRMYPEAKKILTMAYERSTRGKSILYRLAEICVKVKDFQSAEEYYKEYLEVARNDSSRYLLQYKILKGKGAPLAEQIKVLEEYKESELTERWGYELAVLYKKAGNAAKCVEICDDLILWFNEGKYVMKAMELKMEYEPLTAMQQRSYEKNRRIQTEGGSSANAGRPVVEPIGGTRAVSGQESAPQARSARPSGYTSPYLGNTTNLKAELSKSLREVFPTVAKEQEAAQEEAAAAVMPEDTTDYRIRDLEPEKMDVRVKLSPDAQTMIKTRPEPKKKPAAEPAPGQGEQGSSYGDLDLEALFRETASNLSEEIAAQMDEVREEPDAEPVAASTAEPETEPAAEPGIEPAEAPETEPEGRVAEVADAESGEAADIEPGAESEETADIEPVAEPEETADMGPAVEPEETADIEPVAEPEEAADMEPVAEPEEAADIEPVAEPESSPAEADDAEPEDSEEDAELDAAERLETGLGIAAFAEFGDGPKITQALSGKAKPEPAAEQEEEPSAPAVSRSGQIPEEEVMDDSGEEADLVRVSPEDVNLTPPAEPQKEAVADATIRMDDALKRPEDASAAKIPEGVVPMSEEEVLREETPEETRIRILNDFRPEKFSDEQRVLFTYFARVPGMDQQILDALHGVYQHVGEKTSHRGNIAIMGGYGTGKTRLSEGLLRAICMDLKLPATKMARLDATDINRKDPARVIGKLAGGFLLIERAGLMYPETIEKLSKAMDFRTDSLILIIEDEKVSMRGMFHNYPEFADKFENVISIPVFTNDELVTFARTYARENGYRMDEMGVLALYTKIGENQKEGEPMTITQVKKMVDRAISHAGKGARKLGRKMSGRHRDSDDRIILYEKDFDF